MTRAKACAQTVAALLCFAAPIVALGYALVTARSGFAIAASAAGIAAALIAAVLYVRMSTAHGELTQVRAHLRTQIRVDTLTGLLNRAAFLDAFAWLDLPPSTQISVLFIDLDKFKDVNDTLGHRAGDQVLVEAARRCRALVGDDAPLARLGGDEFAAMIRCDGGGAPEAIGRAIADALSEPMLVDDKLVTIGASVGIAVGVAGSDGMEELLRRADIAMYDAKGSQRGACRVFDDALSSRQSLDSSIRVALGQSAMSRDLAMVYQPVIDARGGQLASVEALLRWRSPDIGDVAPATLIPIAEESGHIEKLTDWTLDIVFDAIQRLDGIGVAVNVSPVYFKHPEFVHRIFDRLLAARVRPDLLTLEITEGVLISNIERAQITISRLREIGVKIFLDDFGTGYSSLSYLQHFALDGLKLDKSFLRNVGDKRQATQIIRTMISFGHSLDMKVVAEGVENDWQVRLLQLIGCDLLQGYQLGAPMSLDDIPRFVARGAVDLSEHTDDYAERLPRLIA